MKPRVALYDKVYKDENCIEREVVVTFRDTSLETVCSFKKTVKVVDLSPFLKCFSFRHGHVVLDCFTLCFGVFVCMDSC